MKRAASSNPGAEARPEVHSQAQFARSGGGPGELVVRLGPGAIRLGRDRHRRGDPVEDQLDQGVATLEKLLLRGGEFVWPGPKITFRPALPRRLLRRQPGIEDGVVDVAEGVEIDEAR